MKEPLIVDSSEKIGGITELHDHVKTGFIFIDPDDLKNVRVRSE